MDRIFSGLRDENGMMYTPNLVRVGLNVHHSVQAVSMDTLVRATDKMSLILILILIFHEVCN